MRCQHSLLYTLRRVLHNRCLNLAVVYTVFRYTCTVLNMLATIVMLPCAEGRTSEFMKLCCWGCIAAGVFLLGIANVRCGWIQHEAGHSSLTTNPKVTPAASNYAASPDPPRPHASAFTGAAI